MNSQQHHIDDGNLQCFQTRIIRDFFLQTLKTIEISVIRDYLDMVSIFIPNMSILISYNVEKENVFQILLFDFLIM